MTASSYDEALRRVLVHEGGYSNHPSDPGGPTNWGITIQDARAYWKKEATAADVRSMPVDVAKDIYRSKYWDAMCCDNLPTGVDYAVFDYGVNSGIARAARVLQRLVGAGVDGEIGPDTIAATARAKPAKLINQICDERLAFLQGLKTWSVFGNGWGRRVHEVRAAAVAMAGARSGDIGGSPPWLATMRAITGTREYAGGSDNPVILQWARFIGQKYPEMRSYCAQYNHDAIAWCGLTVAYCMARNGIRPVFGKSENERFLWADAWRRFGVRLDKPKPGCVMVFTRNGGGGHVARQRLPGPRRQPNRRCQSHANSQEQMHRSHVAGDARNRHPSLRARQGQIAKGFRGDKGRLRRGHRRGSRGDGPLARRASSPRDRGSNRRDASHSMRRPDDMESQMSVLGFLMPSIIIVAAYWWVVLPRLRKFSWWDGAVARLWAMAGNSKTILVAYAVELIGVMDEARMLDWSELVGAENAGRVMVIMGAAMILLRLVTRTAVSFKAEA
jgi:uncharacterized protein (TIGR02594 family)